MKLAKILKIALNMVKANKLRSWLTIIGVIIGIASVMAIVTTGEYFQEQVTETLEGLGGDTITIVASTPFEISYEEDVEYEDTGESTEGSAVTTESGGESENYTSDPLEVETEAELTRMDVFVLRSIPGVEYVNVNVEDGAELKLGSESTFVWVKGVDPNVWPEITKKKVGEGRMLTPGDRAVVVISNELAKNTFEKEIRLNQMILLNGKSYRVIGILAKDGGLLGGLGGLFGSSVYMPYQEVYSLRNNNDEDASERERDVYNNIELTLHKDADYDATLHEIERKLRLSRRVTEDTQDFYVNSPKEAIESTRKLINGLTAFLAFIAGISLLVGSTGIANTMFTSVLEKTKEIGIMKAIGAKNSDIMLIFLCNAAMISLVGGIIGILLGTAAVQLILLLISMKMNIPFEFALSLKGTLIATMVSIVVGLIAGLVPAKNASELKPVDALRYE
ncbi:ABC transporter, permease protein [Methanosarcina horonobensis HB-1 = JCM 15518]|uniref:ABC transporter, permease protein n=2 Tax=Methanosarcina horonobensis TaxID=418008 RepID=A0A0E3SDC9_9EURY|nr:ABC transporter permease [Methanosarcina horonobensis]AKB78811.1 ABC transporter, permease protein [Methanosarcina horonobensis HB-1 = JCM 15518]